MDEETFFKIMSSLIVLSFAIATAGGGIANRGKASKATKAIFAGGFFFTALTAILFLMLWNSNSENGFIAVGIFTLISALVMIVGGFIFCARFGATARRVKELDAMTAALAASIESRRFETNTET